MTARKSEKEQPNSLLANLHGKLQAKLKAYLKKLKESFFELQWIALIAHTFPVFSLECEQNFSSMCLIKYDFHAVMKQECLDSLMMQLYSSRSRKQAGLYIVVNKFNVSLVQDCTLTLVDV